MGGRVVWERPGVRFSPELCALGLWRYVDAFGGTDAAGKGRWLTWAELYRRLGDAADGYGPSRLTTVGRAYARVLDALNADHTAVEWLREYSMGWPAGAPPPGEVAEVQRRIEQQVSDVRDGPVRLVDVRDSGERGGSGGRF